MTPARRLRGRLAGTTRKLDTLSSRLMNAVWENGSLWTVNTVAVGRQADVRWYQISTTNSNYSLVQSGTINPGSGIFTIIPAVTVDGASDMGITYTQSSSKQYAAMMFAGRLAGDPLGTLRPGVVVKAGQSLRNDLTLGNPIVIIVSFSWNGTSRCFSPGRPALRPAGLGEKHYRKWVKMFQSGPRRSRLRQLAQKACVRRAVVAVVLLIGLAASPARAGSAPENALLVVNADSWASTAIANEYIHLRQVPPNNVIYLSGLTSFDRMGVEEFRQQILRPVLKAIEERGLAGQVDYVLYSADLPWDISVSDDVAKRPMPNILTPEASINGLTYLCQLVLAKDIRYLDMNCNHYARRVLQRTNDTMWSAEEQQRYAQALKPLMDLAARRREKKKRDKAAAQPAPKAADELDPQETKTRLLEALKVMADMRQAHPHSSDLLYNLACCLNLLERPDEAMAALKEAAQAGWWDYRHAEHDEDLKALRERTDFKELIAEVRKTKFEMQPSAGFCAAIGWSPAGEPVAPADGARYMISTMLAYTSGRGTSVREALAYLRRSAAADGTCPKGTIYFMQNGDIRSTTREWAFRSAAEKLNQIGVRAVIEEGVLPRNKPDVAGAVIGIAGFDWAKSGSTILPGAICEHLTSCGGIMRENGGQTPLSEFLRYGAAGASGTVTEPYAIQAKFPNAFLQVHYAQGCTLGEAFYQSVTGPYQLLIVGDALCKPWAKKLEVGAEGLRANATLAGVVRITPQAKPAEENGPVLYELYLDGRRLMTAKPGERFEFDTRRIADGPHEVVVIGEGGSGPPLQGRLAVPVVVRNGADTLNVTGPPSAEIPWDKTIQLQASLRGAREILFLHNARPVARIAGEKGAVTVDPRVLGQGPVRLQPVGMMSGKDERQIFGNPVDLTIVPPKPLSAADSPAEKESVAGIRLDVAGKPSLLVEKTEGDWLARAGVNKDKEFSLEGYVRVPVDDVYQFQIRGDAKIRALLVDGKAQDWPRGSEWWFVPVPLAQGFHSLRLEGRGADRPTLDLRFGGVGTQRLDPARRNVWCRR